MKKILEVCVDSLASARAAIQGGADRLELCSALSVGGLTPYTALLKQIRCESSIPVRCLMRPRAGDFHYSNDEIRLMVMQIQELRENGANGFVIGCLDINGFLDKKAMMPLLEAAKDSKLTLHRCIDVSANSEKTYCDAFELGIDTVLTSGGAGNCLAGMQTIEKLLFLRDQYNGPEVLIGAGVNASVIATFRKQFPQAAAFHLSGKKEIESRMVFRKVGVPMGLPGLDEWHIQQTCVDTIAAARAALDET